jgi:hypothetical protein
LQVGERLLPYVSANEINYLAFGLPTEEHHNELYEELKYISGDDKIKDFDVNFFINKKHESKQYPWKGIPNEVSVHTFIRNQIHHQKDNGKPTVADLKGSIEKMRIFLKELIVEQASSSLEVEEMEILPQVSATEKIAA